jgi:hypothetical protein
MGNSESKVNTSIINDNEFGVDMSVHNEIQSSCMNTAEQENILQIVGSRVKNLNTNQSNIGKNVCILQTMIKDTRNAQVSNDILTKLSQEIEAKGGLPGTGGTAESITNVYNKMKANVDQSTVNRITKDCIMKLDQKNIIQIFGSDVSDAHLTQANENFAECLQTFDEVKNISGDLSNTAKQELQQSVKSSGMDIFASFGASTLPIILIIIGVFLIISSVIGSVAQNPGAALDVANAAKAFKS